MLYGYLCLPHTIKQLIFTSTQDLCSVGTGSLVCHLKPVFWELGWGLWCVWKHYTTEKQRDVWSGQGEARAQPCTATLNQRSLRTQQDEQHRGEREGPGSRIAGSPLNASFFWICETVLFSTHILSIYPSQLSIYLYYVFLPSNHISPFTCRVIIG